MRYHRERFASDDQCATLVEECDHFFNELNVPSRRAVFEARGVIYPPDLTKGRESFAWVIALENRVTVPALPWQSLPAELRAVSARVLGAIGVTVGIVILNVQRYFSGDASIVQHFDGEYFAWHMCPARGMVVERGLRPRHGALLCIENRAPQCGTLLIEPDGARETHHLGKGELLIFDNQHYTHAAEPFAVLADGRYVRYLIGWRSITENCHLVAGDFSAPISSGEAQVLIAANSGAADVFVEAPF